MFTGIITAMGRVAQLFHLPDQSGLQVVIEVASPWLAKIKKGDSVAVSGCCFTVVDFDDSHLIMDVGPETLKQTYFSTWQVGDAVNLERSATVSQALDGHWVTGHVDCCIHIEKIIRKGESWLVQWSLPASRELQAMIAQKGSVTLNGVSLTVATLTETHFSVMLIPHTYCQTTFQYAQVGQAVNLEVDVLARYVHRQRQHLG